MESYRETPGDVILWSADRRCYQCLFVAWYMVFFFKVYAERTVEQTKFLFLEFCKFSLILKYELYKN